MDTRNVPDLVRKLYGAYVSKNRQVVEDLLSDDFSFTSPYDDHIGRTVYFQKCWPYSERIKAFEIEKLFDKGNEAFIRYEIETIAGDRFRNVEWMRFEGDKLQEVEVYFGSLADDDANGRKD